jgi:hypothetical protein
LLLSPPRGGVGTPPALHSPLVLSSLPSTLLLLSFSFIYAIDNRTFCLCSGSCTCSSSSSSPLKQ